MSEIINYEVEEISEGLRKITLYYAGSELAELSCLNGIMGDWEEIDSYLEEEGLYEVYGDDVEFELLKD